ncbi:MAG: DUF3380 domain-containing protein [Caldilineaceae bacterium]|nr:DUF3380 domain-containing protein [Caldilineaceae bacterium]
MKSKEQEWVQPQADTERPLHYPEYIYGLHESGGEQFMLRAERRGWVLELAAIGLDGSSTPADFSKLADAGLGVMVRINHGYGSAGTLPMPDKYPDFAAACARYVQRSTGCHIWIIGNEPNHGDEQPDHRPILPNDYANAYRLCRSAIRALPGHEQDQVLVAGPGPWNATTTYAGNEKGDWVRYFVHVMTMLDDDTCDGFALHTYTHNLDTSQINGDFFHTTLGYSHLRNEFRTYRDFMNAIPDRFRHLPVFITETDPTTRGVGWNPGHNVGWVQAAYREIANWNSNPDHQPILALLLYRWPLVPDQPEWSISNRPGIVEDFQEALKVEPAADFQIRLPRKGEPPVVLEPGIVLAANEQWTGMVASPLGLNLRSGPTTEHTILRLLPNETALTVLGETEDWLYVHALDRVGYVSSSFVVRQRIGGYMPFVVSPGSVSFLRQRKELMNAILAPNATEQLTLDPVTANWTEQAIANAWNQFGSLVVEIAQLLKIDPAVAVAVLAVESGGYAFSKDGRMLIRFEPHIFFEEWGKLDPERFAQHFRYNLSEPWKEHQWRPSAGQEWRNFHGNQQAEWEVFTFARNSLAPEAAFRSISMGAPQIMGFNHERIGYPSAQAMFEAFAASAHAQIVALFDFVNVEPARLNALRQDDFTTFAASYNGPGQASLYATLMQDGVNTFNRLRATPNVQEPGEEPVVKPVEEPIESNMGDNAQLPVPPSPGNLAEIDPELYAAWRAHILDGFAHNQQMFERLVEAFMGPYHTTVLLYRLVFSVGMLAFVAAVILSAFTGQLMFGVLFGGIGVAAFLSFFISRPLRALEENLNLITWLGVIYNSYWTRLVYAMNMETVQADIAALTNDFTKQMQELLDKSAALHKDRPGAE